jgi:hypothetical protein
MDTWYRAVPCRAVPEHEGLDDGLVQRGLCLHLSLSVADAGTLKLLFPLLARGGWQGTGDRAQRGVVRWGGVDRGCVDRG